MHCAAPFVTTSGQVHGCGQCLPCKMKKREIWTHRIILESHQYTDNAFVTLTYADSALPQTVDGLSTLAPIDLQKFLKRLRKNMQTPLRFFACGEYGSTTDRPHYHLILFNFPSCANGKTILSKRSKPCCSACEMVKTTWGLGAVMLGDVTPESIRYTARYTVKKMTKATDPRLSGRYPEFSRQSRRPGLGVTAMELLSSKIMAHSLELPRGLRHGSKIYPLGSFLQGKLKILTGKEFLPYENPDVQLLSAASGAYEATVSETSAQRWPELQGSKAKIAPNPKTLRELVMRNSRGKIHSLNKKLKSSKEIL